METAKLHHRIPNTVTVAYTHKDKLTERCFVVGDDGNLSPIECKKRKGPNSSQPKLVDTSLGLGDVVAKATKSVGIQPCGKCRKRQESLNKATPTWASKVLGRLLKPS